MGGVGLAVGSDLRDIHRLTELRYALIQREGDRIPVLGQFVGGYTDRFGEMDEALAEALERAAGLSVDRAVHNVRAEVRLVVDRIHRLFRALVRIDARRKVERGRLVGLVGIEHVEIEPLALGQRFAGKLVLGIGEHAGPDVEGLVQDLY